MGETKAWMRVRLVRLLVVSMVAGVYFIIAAIGGSVVAAIMSFVCGYATGHIARIITEEQK